MLPKLARKMLHEQLDTLDVNNVDDLQKAGKECREIVYNFSKLFDGFSIGSNDLTQVTLGVDRDSEVVAFDYEERDEGVKEMIRLAVEGCKRNNRHRGICGQAPSDYPEMAEYLVLLGIESMSLNPDTALKTIENVGKLENKLGR